jgi:hypothetical protein
MLDAANFQQYIDAIDREGYVEVGEAFAPDRIRRINQLIARPLQIPTINGKRGYVQFGDTRFLTSTFFWGREIVDLYTDPVLIDIADRYVGDRVHLSNHRIYQSRPSREIMPWHVDNKIDTFDYDQQKFVTTMATQDRGFILILYLSDVTDGGLQLVSGSHTWSHKANKETWDGDEQSFHEKIVTFNNRPAGTAILYDARAIHRARPYGSGPKRTSLFAQYSSSTMPVGEPIVLNARDIPGLSQLQHRVLNFGLEASTENWPIGSTADLFGVREWLSLGVHIAADWSRRILKGRTN